MSINVTMYKNFSKRENSTKQPINTNAHVDYPCDLKANTSVMDPVLELRISGTAPNDTPVHMGLNYCYISDLNRYYFITDWKYDRGLWTASCRVDVLASYKTQIGGLAKYINRSSSNYDLNVVDDLYPTKAGADISYVTNLNPFRVAPFGSFIVGIIGKGQSNVPCLGGINYYLFTYTEMQEFITYLTSPTFASLIKDDAAGLTSNVVKAIVNPTDYIESCYWFPFTITGNTQATKVQPYIGWWDNISPVTGGITPLGDTQGFDELKFPVDLTGINSLTVTDHTQIARGNYLNAEPYSRYTFHMDPWGDIPLDGQIVMNNKTITYNIQCEALNGMGVLELYSGSTLLARRVAQVGVCMAISQIIDSIAEVSGASLAVGGAAGAATSKTNLKAAALNYTSDISSTGVNGSLINYCFTSIALSQTQTMYSNGPWIKIVRFTLVGEYLAEFGRPAMGVYTISTLSGYVECADTEHDVAALDEEKTAIGMYLHGGFFYE